MNLRSTNRLFVTFYTTVFLFNLLSRCAVGLKREVKEEKLSLKKDPAPAPQVHPPWTEPVDPALPPYLYLPVFLDSLKPLLDPEHFRPSADRNDPLPVPIQELLMPDTTEPPPRESRPEDNVRIDCKHNRMFVEVDRVLLGNSDVRKSLRLGSCYFSKTNDNYAHFELKLSKCGTEQSLDQDQVVFSNILQFEPEPTRSLIRRSAPFSLPVSCHFNRYQYSYKVGYRPKFGVQHMFKRIRNRDKFILTPRNARWELMSPSENYTLGRPMFFEAQTELLSPEKRLYVHFCFATPEPSASSPTRFNVINNYGCMVESVDGRSAFIPSPNNVVRFSVDAFIFAGLEANTLFMHCTMSVGPYSPTATDKSCNFHPETRRWVELNGSDSVCSCCQGTCGSDGSSEKVITSKAWNIDVKTTAAPKKKRPKVGGSKKSKSSPRSFKPKPSEVEVDVLSGASEPVSENVRWAVTEAEPQEVVGSAAVEQIKEPKTRKRVVFEEVFGLD